MKEEKWLVHHFGWCSLWQWPWVSSKLTASYVLMSLFPSLLLFILMGSPFKQFILQDPVKPSSQNMPSIIILPWSGLTSSYKCYLCLETSWYLILLYTFFFVCSWWTKGRGGCKMVLSRSWIRKCTCSIQLGTLFTKGAWCWLQPTRCCMFSFYALPVNSMIMRSD